MDIKFTIITASYNYKKYIKETIDSVLAQTYQNWEMLIIDDGSSDNSIEIINSYCKKDERIKLLTHPNNQNKGLIETIKLGIKEAKTDWIAFLESDDTITSDYLQRKYEVIQKENNTKFIFNDVNLFGDKERIRQYDEYFKTLKKILSQNKYPKSQLHCFKKRNIVPTFSCVALKKELLDDIDFNCPIKAIIDIYIWIQIARKTSLYYLDEKLTNWRMHKSYITQHKTNQKDMAKFKLKKDLFILNPHLSFLSIFLYLYYMLRLAKINLKNLIKKRGK